MTQTEQTIMTDLDTAQTIIQKFIIQYTAIMKLPLQKLSSIVEPKNTDLSKPFRQKEMDDIEENLFIIETLLDQLMADIEAAKKKLTSQAMETPRADSIH